MEVHEFLSLAKRRRMVSEYAHKTVAQLAILNILDAARWAPSGYNLQPWQFIVVDEPEQKGMLVQVVEHEAAKARELGHNVRVPNYLRDVPVFIAVVSDPRMKQKLPPHRTGASADKIYLSSVSAAIQNMHLAAAAQGLGTVWFTVSSGEETQSELRGDRRLPTLGAERHMPARGALFESDGRSHRGKVETRPPCIDGTRGRVITLAIR